MPSWYVTWSDNVTLGEKHTSLRWCFCSLYCRGYSHRHFARFFPLTDLCVHFIPVYTIKLGLRVFLMPVLYCIQFIVRCSVYFKIRWPGVSLVMNLLMRYFWKMEVWFSRIREQEFLLFLCLMGLIVFIVVSSRVYKTKLSAFKIL